MWAATVVRAAVQVVPDVLGAVRRALKAEAERGELRPCSCNSFVTRRQPDRLVPFGFRLRPAHRGALGDSGGHGRLAAKRRRAR